VLLSLRRRCRRGRLVVCCAQAACVALQGCRLYCRRDAVASAVAAHAAGVPACLSAAAAPACSITSQPVCCTQTLRHRRWCRRAMEPCTARCASTLPLPLTFKRTRRPRPWLRSEATRSETRAPASRLLVLLRRAAPPASTRPSSAGLPPFATVRRRVTSRSTWPRPHTTAAPTRRRRTACDRGACHLHRCRSRQTRRRSQRRGASSAPTLCNLPCILVETRLCRRRRSVMGLPRRRRATPRTSTWCRRLWLGWVRRL
jgi:hypothetical protein